MIVVVEKPKRPVNIGMTRKEAQTLLTLVGDIVSWDETVRNSIEPDSKQVDVAYELFFKLEEALEEKP